MQMYMKEPYVSFKIAKLLKEKGFDWFTFGYYTMDDYDSPPYFGIENLCADNWNGEAEEVNDLWFSAPTQQMALRWLKEIHGLWIITMPCKNGDCYFEIYKRYGKIWKNNVYDHMEYENFDEPENAVEEALEYCLINMI